MRENVPLFQRSGSEVDGVEQAVAASLDRLSSEGVSLLVVEQYVNKALAIADYAYILGRGRITFAGDASELADDDVFSRYLGSEVGAGAG